MNSSAQLISVLLRWTGRGIAEVARSAGVGRSNLSRYLSGHRVGALSDERGLHVLGELNWSSAGPLPNLVHHWKPTNTDDVVRVFVDHLLRETVVGALWPTEHPTESADEVHESTGFLVCRWRTTWILIEDRSTAWAVSQLLLDPSTRIARRGPDYHIPDKQRYQAIISGDLAPQGLQEALRVRPHWQHPLSDALRSQLDLCFDSWLTEELLRTLLADGLRLYARTNEDDLVTVYADQLQDMLTTNQQSMPRKEQLLALRRLALDKVRKLASEPYQLAWAPSIDAK